MRLSTLSFTSALLACSIASHAEYRAEISAAYIDMETTLGAFSTDTDGWDLSGTYYFDNVDSSKGPLAEAAFLDRASGISGSFSRLSNDDLGMDLNSHGISGLFVSKQTGWLFGAAFEKADLDQPDADINTYAIRAGKYIADNSTLSVSYGYSEDADYSGSDKLQNYSLDFRHLSSTESGHSYAIAGYLGKQDSLFNSKDTLYGGSYTLYLNNNLGFGASMDMIDSDYEEIFGYSLFASWFVNESIGLSLSYTNEEADEFDFENETLAVAISARL